VSDHGQFEVEGVDRVLLNVWAPVLELVSFGKEGKDDVAQQFWPGSTAPKGAVRRPGAEIKIHAWAA
jgi:hypothetical protein